MSIAQGLLPEFDHEMASTRRVLERIPADQTAFKPHAKSYSLADLGVHLANIPTWIPRTLGASELDLNPPGGPDWVSPTFESIEATLRLFDTNVSEAKAALAGASDAALRDSWRLKNAGQVVFTLPRAAVLRSMVINHMIHHRGQLTVYLRMCDVPLPSLYGPSADERS